MYKRQGHPHVQKGTAYTILFAMGFCHLLNDMIQSVIPAMYPVLKVDHSFACGYGTVLFFEDQKVVKGLQEAFPSYQENFPENLNWSGMTEGSLFPWRTLRMRRT